MMGFSKNEIRGALKRVCKLHQELDSWSTPVISIETLFVKLMARLDYINSRKLKLAVADSPTEEKK